METEKRIIEKDIYNEMLAKAEPKEVRISMDLREISGKASLITDLNGLSKDEAMQKLFNMFEYAASNLGVPVSSMRFSGSGTYSGFSSVRLETEEEMIYRIQCAASRKADNLRRERKDKQSAANYKKRRIEILERELADLKK